MSAGAVGVVGAGCWGTTLAKILAENKRPTLLWTGREELCREINERRSNERYLPGVCLPESLEATTDLGRVCQSSPLLILALPAYGLRVVARRLGDFLRGDQLVVHAAKGLEGETLQRMSEVLREETCARKIGVLSGPLLARELVTGAPAGALLSSRYHEVISSCQEALHNRHLRVYGGSDVAGAEVGGAFATIAAVAAGAVEGLGLGCGTRALLLARSLKEMMLLGGAMGADPMTFSGMAGVGELAVACSSLLSQNYQLGQRLARGESLRAIESSGAWGAEAAGTTRAIQEYARRRQLDLPLVRAVHQLLYQGTSPRELVEGLMSRRVGPELPGVPRGASSGT